MEVDLQFSVGTALSKAQIVPRSEPYLLQDIQDALRTELSAGKNVQINCLMDKKAGFPMDFPTYFSKNEVLDQANTPR